MTDPIQTSNPAQQGQQGTTDPIQQPIPPQQQSQQGPIDDILGGEDIFATIPEANTQVNVPEFKQIPEAVKVAPVPPTQPVKTSVVQPVPVNKPIPPVAPVAPIPESIPEETTPEEDISEENILEEEIPEEISEEEIEEIEQEEAEEEALEEVKSEDSLATALQTDVQKKFGELFFTTKKIYALKNRMGINEESFDILGANNDKIFISYRFFIDETEDPMLFITKIEQDKETDEETTNELKFTFNQENASLEVIVNDTLLFDEIHDFTEDQKKKLQVVDKLNKFTFLASEELRKMEKEIKEKEENEKERRKLQEIFRNF